jgi:hypothetical protein
MSYEGDIRLEDTMDIKFCTVTTTGAPTVLAGSPVISAYVGNSTTQITAGITLSVDFDSVVGLNNVRVAATAANGYTAPTDVTLVITTGTVGGTSVVGYCVGSFSIEHRSAVMPTTAARKLDVSAGGEAGVDWANVGSPTTTVGLSGTTVKTATDVETDTADIQSRLPAALVGGRIDANVGAISGDATAADNEEAFFDGTGYAGTNNVIPLVTVTTTATNVTTVNGLAANVITAASIANGAIGATEIADGAIDAATFAAGAIDAAALAADAVTEIQTGLATAAALDTVDNFLDTEIAAIKAKTDGLNFSGANVLAEAAVVADKTGYAIGAGGIDAAAFAAGAIDASAIATDAIGAAEIAATAIAEIADGILDRNMATGTDSGSTTVRTPRQALRAIRNKVGIAAGTLTVTKEDDSTASWTAAVTTTAGNPISEVDPAGP